MKNSYYFGLVLVLMTGCGSSKKSKSSYPAENDNYALELLDLNSQLSLENDSPQRVFSLKMTAAKAEPIPLEEAQVSIQAITEADSLPYIYNLVLATDLDTDGKIGPGDIIEIFEPSAHSWTKDGFDQSDLLIQFSHIIDRKVIFFQKIKFDTIKES